MSAKEIKEKIIEDIEKLPEDFLEEIKDFIDFKLSKTILENKDKPEVQGSLDPSKDPILKTIGSFDGKPCAHKIDDELYGKIN